MKSLIQSFIVTLTIVSTFLIGNAACGSSKSAPMQGQWEQLGTRTVSFGLDRDEIAVTAREGFFTALKLKVDRSALNMHKMVIHFGDGTTQDVEMRNTFRAGDESRAIDLSGNRRVITKVVFWYDTKNNRKARAVVELWGRH
jgi:hypothetical protein